MQGEWDETEVQCLMWLVRWQLRLYRRHRQYEELLSAAYARAWSAVVVLVGDQPAEAGKRVSKAARWAAADWFRSVENEGRTHTRSHGRLIALPGRVGLKEGFQEHETALLRETDPDAWVERLIEGIDERARGEDPG